MRAFMIGPTLHRVLPEVEAAWPDVEARSRAVAAEFGDGAFVRFRTDSGVRGSIPLPSTESVVFHEVDDAADPDEAGAGAGPHLGTIVALLPGDASPWPDDVDTRGARSDIDIDIDIDIEGMPEDERQRILAALHAAAPHIDHERLAAGTLGGRATPDRPDVPPWEYRRSVAEHRDISLADLITVRFPEVHGNGRDATVRSVAADVDDPRGASDVRFTADDALDLWEHLHDAGAVRWNSATRAVEHVGDGSAVETARRDYLAARRHGQRTPDGTI